MSRKNSPRLGRVCFVFWSVLVLQDKNTNASPAVFQEQGQLHQEAQAFHDNSIILLFFSTFYR